MRIFTPKAELPFAGHPVLGTAFVVGTALKAPAITLETPTGPVPVRLELQGGKVVYGRMSQPIPTFEPYRQADDLLRALGVSVSGLPIEIYRNGPEHVFVKLADRDTVAALEPDMAALAALGVAANCFTGNGLDIKTRMFYPAAGVPEDSATGSAAGPLAVHLARHSQIAFGDEITIVQGEEIGRPSRLHASVFGTPDRIEKVEVGGAAVIVAEGQYLLKASQSS